ncbi:MAG TPA: hypothetical protein VN783_07610, partial [Thermoanaerobaculia bacterium]|nr:hypothetical protein [Thermoanaerobaculia bacterium]
PGARPREIARAALLALVVAALAYLYLPIAASRHPALNWGDPSSLARFWRHVSGRQYQVYLAIGPDDLGAQVREIAGYVGREFGPPWLPVALALAALGLLAAWRTDRGFALALCAIGAADLGLSLIYDIAEDQDAYLLPLFFALALALGLGIATLIGRLPAGRRARLAAPVLALLPAAIAFAANLPYDDRHRDRLAEQYVEDALHVVAPGSLILTLDWQLYSPMRYFQDIEGRRRDALAIDLNLLRRSWYLADLRRAAPAVLAEVRPEADAYLVDLLAWEADPQRFGSDPARVGRLSQRYRTLVTALAERQLRHGRLYATHDLISGAPENDPEAHQALGSYQAVPRGILFELTRGPEVRPLAPLRLAALPSLFGGVRRFAPDDVVEKKILPVYVDAFLFQATYLAGNHLPDQALATLDQGLAAIPEGNPTRDLLARRRGEIAGSATLPP